MTATNNTSPEDSPVPVIDFGFFIGGSESEQKEVAAQVDEAFRTVGFVYLTNHSVPQEKLEECFKWSERFFSLPLETKMLAPHPPGGSHHRGYSAPSQEKVVQHVYDKEEVAKMPPDVKESFEAGKDTDGYQPNVWLPEEKLPGFRGFIESFYGDCTALVHALLTCLNIALSIPDRTFLSKTHSLSNFQLRLLHYPPTPTSELLSKQKNRIGAHSDFGTITLLFQDSIGGLEVESPADSGIFQPAPPVPGAVLVNIGDLMMQWSNGRWRSTVHRVGAPPVSGRVDEVIGNGESTSKARYSIPFFASPNADAIIEALPGTFDENNPPQWEKVNAREYVQRRMATTYG